MIFGLTWEKLLLIGVLAAVIIGPDRLPRVAETFAQFLHRAGTYVRGAKSKLKEEMGPELDDVDWRKLDPRQYDPRRIIRDAIFEEPGAKAPIAAAGAAAAAAPIVTDGAVRPAPPRFDSETPPPFDDEAT